MPSHGGAIHRLWQPPDAFTLVHRIHTVYAVELSVAPSPKWRIAFLRPPRGLVTAQYAPKVVRLELDGSRITFRTIPARLHACVRRIDEWIAYANSVVRE